jgi:hypothetical protein
MRVGADDVEIGDVAPARPANTVGVTLAAIQRDVVDPHDHRIVGPVGDHDQGSPDTDPARHCNELDVPIRIEIGGLERGHGGVEMKIERDSKSSTPVIDTQTEIVAQAEDQIIVPVRLENGPYRVQS